MADPIVAEPEEWRAVVGFPDYEVSSLGRVRRATPGHATWPGRILKPIPRKGYLTVHPIASRGVPFIPLAIHVAVCEAFHGPKPTPEHQVAHWDGAGHNNRRGNVRWATSKQNMVDRERHGRTRRGDRHANAKLTAAKVMEARRRHSAGESCYALAKEFGVHRKTLRHAIMGITWNFPANKEQLPGPNPP